MVDSDGHVDLQQSGTMRAPKYIGQKANNPNYKQIFHNSLNRSSLHPGARVNIWN